MGFFVTKDICDKALVRIYTDQMNQIKTNRTELTRKMENYVNKKINNFETIIDELSELKTGFFTGQYYSRLETNIASRWSPGWFRSGSRIHQCLQKVRRIYSLTIKLYEKANFNSIFSILDSRLPQNHIFDAIQDFEDTFNDVRILKAAFYYVKNKQSKLDVSDGFVEKKIIGYIGRMYIQKATDNLSTYLNLDGISKKSDCKKAIYELQNLVKDFEYIEELNKTYKLKIIPRELSYHFTNKITYALSFFLYYFVKIKIEESTHTAVIDMACHILHALKNDYSPYDIIRVLMGNDYENDVSDRNGLEFLGFLKTFGVKGNFTYGFKVSEIFFNIFMFHFSSERKIDYLSKICQSVLRDRAQDMIDQYGEDAYIDKDINCYTMADMYVNVLDDCHLNTIIKFNNDVKNILDNNLLQYSDKADKTKNLIMRLVTNGVSESNSWYINHTLNFIAKSLVLYHFQNNELKSPTYLLDFYIDSDFSFISKIGLLIERKNEDIDKQEQKIFSMNISDTSNSFTF